jgi:hypothetical protein
MRVSVVGIVLSVIAMIVSAGWMYVMEEDILVDLSVVKKNAEVHGTLKKLTYVVSPSDKLTQMRPVGIVLNEPCPENSPALVYRTANWDQACLERYCFHSDMNYWALVKECRNIPASEYKSWWWENINTLKYFVASTPERYREAFQGIKKVEEVAPICAGAFIAMFFVLSILVIARDDKERKAKEEIS